MTIWSAETGGILKQFKAHDGWVETIAISSDGRGLASGGPYGKVRYWNLAKFRADTHAPEDFQLRIKNVDQLVQGQQPSAQIIVEGRPTQVVLDTGFGHNILLFLHHAESLKLKVEQHDGFATALARYEQVNGTLSGPYNTLVAPMAPTEFQGMLGWPLIKQHIWYFHYQENFFHTLTDIPGDLFEEATTYEIIENPEGGLDIAVPTENEPVLITIDTGMEGPLALPKAYWEQWRANHPDSWTTIGAAYSPAAGGFYTSLVAFAEHLSIGSLEFKAMFIKENKFKLLLNGRPRQKVSVNLGVEAMEHHEIWIDGPGGHVYFKPVEELNRPKVIKINRAQATYLPESLEHEYMYAHVLKNGVAYRAGLRQGDKILLVNGRDARNWRTDRSVRPGRVLKQAPGTVVELLIERNELEKTIVFELEPCPLDPVDS
jgi:hypothetical protein